MTRLEALIINNQLAEALKYCIIIARRNDPYTSIYQDKIQLDKYFGEYDYVQVKGLYDFVSKCDHIPSETITHMIRANSQSFGFFNKIIVSNKDFIDEMRDYGLAYACKACRNFKLLLQNQQQISRQEQTLEK